MRRTITRGTLDIGTSPATALALAHSCFAAPEELHGVATERRSGLPRLQRAACRPINWGALSVVVERAFDTPTEVCAGSVGMRYVRYGASVEDGGRRG
jgi:hypothetical protein